MPAKFADVLVPLRPTIGGAWRLLFTAASRSRESDASIGVRSWRIRAGPWFGLTAARPLGVIGWMLVIRDAQMARLAEATFEREILAHLRAFFPDRVADLGEPGALALVHAGLAKAKAYGLSDDAHCCQLVDLMLLFGRDFDTDPRVPWAGRILADPSIESADVRMHRLGAAARTVIGGDT